MVSNFSKYYQQAYQAQPQKGYAHAAYAPKHYLIGGDAEIWSSRIGRKSTPYKVTIYIRSGLRGIIPLEVFLFNMVSFEKWSISLRCGRSFRKDAVGSNPTRHPSLLDSLAGKTYGFGPYIGSSNLPRATKLEDNGVAL